MIGNAYAFSLEKHSLKVLPWARARKPGAQVESRGRPRVAWWDAPVGNPGWGGESLGLWEGPEGAAPAGCYPVAKPQFPGPGRPATPSRELSPPARYGGGSRDQDQHGRRRCWELRCRRRRAAGGNPPASPPSPAGLPRGPECQRLGLGRHRAAAGGVPLEQPRRLCRGPGAAGGAGGPARGRK